MLIIGFANAHKFFQLNLMYANHYLQAVIINNTNNFNSTNNSYLD